MRISADTMEDIKSNMRENSRNFLRAREEQFEQDFALTMLATAKTKNQNANQHKTTTQVINNKTTTAVIEYQLDRYGNEYNDLPNKMRHYG
ncbi:MAG: hypothetical protein ACXIVD_02235 [Salinarimonas sp.]